MYLVRCEFCLCTSIGTAAEVRDNESAYTKCAELEKELGIKVLAYRSTEWQQ